MKQSATERPNPSLQRKAAVANGAAVDHAGVVRVKPIDNFDLNRTIFQTLEGAAPRFVIKTRIAKEEQKAREARERELAEQRARDEARVAQAARTEEARLAQARPVMPSTTPLTAPVAAPVASTTAQPAPSAEAPAEAEETEGEADGAKRRRVVRSYDLK